MVDKQHRALIIGYGSAGKRHAQLAENRGYRLAIVDPRFSRYSIIETMGWASRSDIRFAYAVVASPPALHLQHVKQCLDAGIPVLCEKPLGTIEQNNMWADHIRDSVAVAYNYRFHPAIRQAQEQVAGWANEIEGRWRVMSVQQRNPLPTWGTLLDHVSHDVDILHSIIGPRLGVRHAKHIANRLFDLWWVSGYVMGSLAEFVITDMTTSFRVPKRAQLKTPQASIPIKADRSMFDRMTDSFLGDWTGLATVAEGLDVQFMLEAIQKKGGV